MAAPNYSNNDYNEKTDFSPLVTIINEQHSALISLQEVQVQLQSTLSEVAYASLSSQLNVYEQKQSDRFIQIDALINDNILRVKKGKTTDNRIFLFGKELRKIEASIRTIKLFLLDVISMLSPTSTDKSRVDDRMQYANQRLHMTKKELEDLEQQIKNLS